MQPQPRSPTEVLIPHAISSQLVVKIDGVISHGPRGAVYRSIAKVELSVTAALQGKLPADSKVGLAERREWVARGTSGYGGVFLSEVLRRLLTGNLRLSVPARCEIKPLRPGACSMLAGCATALGICTCHRAR